VTGKGGGGKGECEIEGEGECEIEGGRENYEGKGE